MKKKILAAALIALMAFASCNFLKEEKKFDKESVPIPVEVVDNKKKVAVIDIDNREQACSFETLGFISTRTIYKSLLTGVYKEYNHMHDEVKPSDYSDTFDGENTDHLFLIEADMQAVSGDNLYFINWLKTQVDSTSGPMVVWSDKIKGNYAELNIDSSLDLMEYLEDEKFTLFHSVRAKSPSEDTTLELTVTFMRLYECGEYE